MINLQEQGCLPVGKIPLALVLEQFLHLIGTP